MGKLTALGYEPNDPKGPDEINTSIQNMYDDRYAKGYKDGVDKTSANAKIVYTYHKHVKGDGTESSGTIYGTTNPGGCYVPGGHTHSSACSKTCTITQRGVVIGDWDGDGFPVRITIDHSICNIHQSYTVAHSDAGVSTTTHTVYGCNNQPVNTWVIGCGKNESSIDKAEITF